MTFHPSSFFAGVGTVLVTVGVGFGAAILVTDAFVGNSEREPSRLEQRTIEAKAAPAVEPVPVLVPQKATQAPSVQAAQIPQPVLQAVPAQPAAQERAFENANARIRDADLQRELKSKKQEWKRERRKAWAERKRIKKEEELRAVAAKVQEERQPQFPRREFVAESPMIRLVDD